MIICCFQAQVAVHGMHPTRLEVLGLIDQVLGVLDLEPAEIDEDVETLIAQREKARKSKDWDKADSLRQELKKKGVEVIDTKEGPVCRKTMN